MTAIHPFVFAQTLLLVALVSGCAAITGNDGASPAAAAPVPEIAPGVLAGYLGDALPDSLRLLPPPPVAGSPAALRDEAIHRSAQALRDGPRYALAAADADLAFPHAAGTFACALDIAISARDTPRLYTLLRRVMADAGLSTYGAKDHYRRTRPFVQHAEHTCFAHDEEGLRADGSYPSGHTAVGWAWALVLTELAPDRGDALLARGRVFGESRLVCNAHWQSDVLAGRVIGAGTVARLHADPAFRRDVDAARAEIAAARHDGSRPDRDCAAENAALAQTLPGVE